MFSLSLFIPVVSTFVRVFFLDYRLNLGFGEHDFVDDF